MSAIKTTWDFKFHFLRANPNYIPIFFYGGPIGPNSVPLDDGELFEGGIVDKGPTAVAFADFEKNFSIFAIMCLPYVYFFRLLICGRINIIKCFRCVGSATSIIFWTT